MTAIRWQSAALVLELQVQPGASRDEIVGLHGDRIRVRITAPPIDGRANAHLVRYLAGCFGTSRSAVTILHGTSGRSKRVSITAPQTVPAALATLIDSDGVQASAIARVRER
jgi:uncharacterized protein (TIGR00251 family)